MVQLRWFVVTLLISLVATGAAKPAPEPVLESVSGSELRRRIDATSAAAVVVNVWATWCQPCREEFPALLKLREDYRSRGLTLMLVSGDFPTEREGALAFLGESGVDFPTYIKAGKDMEFIDSLQPRWSGALPATFVYAGGGLVEWWEGVATYERFAAAVERALKRGAKEKQ